MHSFSKQKRLLTKNAYDYVFSRAKKITTPEFTLLYRENTMGFSRLGLAVSKRNVARAHDRNRIKRLIRESFRQSTLPSIDMIFLVKPGVKEAQNVTIFKSLEQIWSKLNASHVAR